MEEEIIQSIHRKGHFRTKKTRELVEKEFYIPDILQKVNKVVRSCKQCIIAELKTDKPEGLLTSIDKSDKPYHIDHFGSMKEIKKRYNYILVVVVSFSKFVWLFPTKSTGTEK